MLLLFLGVLVHCTSAPDETLRVLAEKGCLVWNAKSSWLFFYSFSADVHWSFKIAIQQGKPVQQRTVFRTVAILVKGSTKGLGQ